MVKFQPCHAVVLVFVLFLGVVGIASADSTYNFDTTPVGTSTPFSLTSNGLTATFQSSSDPSGFVVAPSFFKSLTGNVLLDPGKPGANNLLLAIIFSGDVNSISMNFATNGPGTFAFFTADDGIINGFAQAMGTVPSGFVFPEGTISHSGPAFNEVLMGAIPAPDFAIDNIDVKLVSTPEPASLLLLCSGLAGVAALWRRKLAA